MEETLPATIHLYPNFGAEEGTLSLPLALPPAHAHWARLWSWLFRDPASIIGLNNRDVRDDSSNAPASADGDSPFPIDLRASDDDAGPSEDALGIPWLATPSAWDELVKRGLKPWGPTPEVVRLIHHKGFCREVSSEQGLDPPPIAGLSRLWGRDELGEPDKFVRELGETICKWPSWARAKWTLKPAWGSSGRGRVPGFGRNVDTPEIRGSLPRFRQRLGVILEPFYDRELDLSAQYLVSRGGQVKLLGTLEQQVAESGAYKGHRALLSHEGVRAGTRWDEELVESSRRVVDRAAQLGFVGFCGVDAFVVRLGEQQFLRPAVEFNARFTLGTIALGLIHQAARRISLDSEVRVAFFPALQERGEIDPSGIPWPSARHPVLVFNR